MKDSTTKALALRPSYWASVSGGKDSLYMINLILHNLDRYPLDGVVHFELEIDYPFIHDVIDYMESECKRFGIPFYRIKPRTTWMELYEKRGFPNQVKRWCNKEYKLDAKIQLEKFLQSKGCYLVQYVGFCADEIKRTQSKTQTSKYTKNVYPLVEAGINEDTIHEWAKEQPIFNDYYKYNRRCGCMWCPMASFREHTYLLSYYPDKYTEMMKLALDSEKKREEKIGTPVSAWSSNPKYNTEYRDKRIREKYLPELIDEMSRDKGVVYVSND